MVYICSLQLGHAGYAFKYACIINCVAFYTQPTRFKIITYAFKPLIACASFFLKVLMPQLNLGIKKYTVNRLEPTGTNCKG